MVEFDGLGGPSYKRQSISRSSGPPMRVIPVIDLMQGRVVRGIAGRRESYLPIESPLAESALAGPIASVLAREFGCSEIYVADLDAIAGAEPDRQSLAAIANEGFSLWVDAGIGTSQRAAGWSRGELGQLAAKAIVGLESVASAEALAEVFQVLGGERAVFSLDLKNQQPLCGQGWKNLDAEQIAQTAVEIGFRSLIVLDLAEVGMGRGAATIEQLCNRLHRRYPQVELISGGGVRNLGDLKTLAQAGCSAALVASALHDGRITAADLAIAARF